MPKSLTDFKNRQRSEPDWILPGLLKRQNTAFMIGPPKRAAKSWLLLAMAWDLSEGAPVWGVKRPDGAYLFPPPRPMRTVYFTQEDAEDDIHDRVFAHLALGRPDNDKLWIVPKNWNLKLDSMNGARMIQGELDEVREQAGDIDVVMFDPMREMHSGDENDSRAISQIFGVVNRIQARYQCSVVFSHHVRKPPEDKTYYDPTDPFIARGSSAIFGGADAFMTIAPGERTDAWQRVGMFFESKRGRPLHPAQLKVHLPSEAGVFDVGVTKAVEWLGEGQHKGERTISLDKL